MRAHFGRAERVTPTVRLARRPFCVLCQLAIDPLELPILSVVVQPQPNTVLRVFEQGLHCGVLLFVSDDREIGPFLLAEFASVSPAQFGLVQFTVLDLRSDRVDLPTLDTPSCVRHLWIRHLAESGVCIVTPPYAPGHYRRRIGRHILELGPDPAGNDIDPPACKIVFSLHKYI